MNIGGASRGIALGKRSAEGAIEWRAAELARREFVNKYGQPKSDAQKDKLLRRVALAPIMIIDRKRPNAKDMSYRIKSLKSQQYDRTRPNNGGSVVAPELGKADYLEAIETNYRGISDEALRGKLEEEVAYLQELGQKEVGLSQAGRALRGIYRTLSIVTLLAGLFFLSSNITGNAIGNITNSTSSVIGACLLVVGLVAGFFWMKKR